ncbi:MAG: hypothetical protein GC147_08930 [Porphyrobacter sp.]|nr:hypothetical protein [Porphyrobacter sp.]
MIIAGSPAAFGRAFAARGGEWLDTRTAFVLLCAAAIAPLLFVGFPPLVDLYGHLGRYAVQTDLANRPMLQQFYSFDWQLIGNLGADLLVEVLHRWFGLEGATRLVVIATQALAAGAILLASRELHGRITPFAIAALPLIYGLPFNYGFLNFSLSMALGLLAFVVWLRLGRQERVTAQRLFLAVAGVAIWVCHAYGWAFLGLLCGSSVLAQVIAARASPIAAIKRILASCWPLLLPLAPMIVWRSETGGLDVMGWSFAVKVQWLVSLFRIRWVVPDIASVVAVFCLIYWAMREKNVRFDRRMSIAALLSFLCYAALPRQVFGSMFADVRLVPYILITVLLAISPRGIEARTLRVLGLVAAAFFLGRMAVTGASYVAQEAKVDAVLPALNDIPEGARVAVFATVPCRARWELPVLSHMGGVALARRSVFVNNLWQAPGANLLRVHYPIAAPFEHDPSQNVYAESCDAAAFPTLAASLAKLPRAAFTNVWITGPLPRDFAVPQDLRPLRRAGESILFAVEKPRAQPQPGT